MASTNVIPIYTYADFLGIGEYLADPHHPNHGHHNLDGPILHDTKSIDTFANEVLFAIDLLNRERRPQHQIEIHGYWCIWRFEDRSVLSNAERLRFQTHAIASFAQGAPVYGYWHNDWFLETADLNLLIPAFHGESLPYFRRNKDNSFYAKCRSFSDELVAELNDSRKSSQKPLLQTSTDAHIEAIRTSRWETMEKKVAKHACTIGTKPTLANLPALFIDLGMVEDEDWVIEGNISIRFRRRSKTRNKWFRIRTAEFLQTVEIEIAQIGGLRTSETPTIASLNDHRHTDPIFEPRNTQQASSLDEIQLK